jgi:hypothetical protein
VVETLRDVHAPIINEVILYAPTRAPTSTAHSMRNGGLVGDDDANIRDQSTKM